MNLSPQYDLYTIIPHTSESRLLLLSGRDGWSLPCFVSEESHPGNVGHINRAVGAQLGIKVTVLRCIYSAAIPGVPREQRVYVLENHSPDQILPPGGRWVSRGELEGLVMAEHIHRPLLDRWFAEVKGGCIPEQRVPWARPGWFGDAKEWIQEQLDRSGLEANRPIEQIRNWAISCILQVETSSGMLYCKAVPDVFDYAPRLIQTLAEWYPHSIPSVLAIDAKRRWALLHGFGGDTLEHEASLLLWAEVLRCLARIQMDCVGRTEILRSLGCPTLCLDEIASQVDRVLTKAGLIAGVKWEWLTTSEIERLQALRPRLVAACEQLSGYNLPETLVHNDFHAGNIAIQGESIVFFDWTDSSLTQPFFSLVALFDSENFVIVGPDEQAWLRDAYLEAWNDYAPMEQLIKAFRLALPVGAFYHAVNHWRVLSRIEVDSMWGLESSVSYWLRKLLCHETYLP